MSGRILNLSSGLICPHGGKVVATPTSTCGVGGVPPLKQTDFSFVVGCPLVIGTVPSPCVAVVWKPAGNGGTDNGIPILGEDVIGDCYGPAGLQGTVQVISTQCTASQG